MDEPLTPHAGSFAQDMDAWPVRSCTWPGCRPLQDIGVITLRHATDSAAARQAIASQGWAWPEATGEMQGDLGLWPAAKGGPLLLRRNTGEVLIFGADASAQHQLLAALRPGAASDAAAIDLSHGMTVIALEGPRLDEWLARLVDAAAVPREAGRACRTRLVDVAVWLLRLAPDLVWLAADRAVSSYIANWLAFSHEAAFAAAPAAP